MSIIQSPLIATNGLVFGYDMYNSKSWKGEPVTNQFTCPAPSPAGVDGNVSFAVQGNGTFQRIYSGTYGGYTIQPTDVVYRYNLGGGGCHYHGNSAAIGSGQYVCYSVDYYISPDASDYPTEGSLVVLENYGAGALGGGTGVGGVSVMGKWQTIQGSAGPTGSSGTQAMFLYPGGCSGVSMAGRGFILMKNPMFEFRSDVRFNPFVNGTRSSTQALVDLTNNNTNTVNSLTYASDGTFSFNGSNSITVPFNSSQFTFNNGQTIIIWMKNQSPSSARRNPYNQAYAGGGTITHENDSVFNYYFGQGGGDNSPYTGFTSSFSVVVGETAMICLTRNASTVSWYKNGVLVNDIANPYGAGVVTGTNNITIGSGYAGGFGGSLYAVQLYNRALSAPEVLQNFNALRGRYGL